jgi:8-oxo-dGTP pyrophosphatase MutT (NUDIX family)
MAYTTMMLPVSVKGVVFQDEKVWLRRNERSEWELPGGKLDPGEQPAETVEREMAEELGMRVRAVAPVHAHRHVIPGSVDESDGVLVLSYLCEVLSAGGPLELEGEGGKARFEKFSPDDLRDVRMPGFYRTAIAAAHTAAKAAAVGA